MCLLCTIVIYILLFRKITIDSSKIICDTGDSAGATINIVIIIEIKFGHEWEFLSHNLACGYLKVKIVYKLLVLQEKIVY